MKTSPADLLKLHDLRVTEVRKSCIRHLQKSSSAISSTELEKELKGVDRITLYRTLISFEESGIVHHSIDAAGQKKYALCADSCDSHKHHDNHIHFHCNSCGESECLDDQTPTNLKLPKGYQVKDVQFNVMGICSNCN